MRRVSSRNIYFLLLCLCLLIFGGCTKSTGKDTETDTTEVPATTEALETVALKDAEIGDIVQMGIYEQDGNPETDDPICWDMDLIQRRLKMQNGRKVLSENSLSFILSRDRFWMQRILRLVL